MLPFLFFVYPAPRSGGTNPCQIKSPPHRLHLSGGLDFGGLASLFLGSRFPSSLSQLVMSETMCSSANLQFAAMNP